MTPGTLRYLAGVIWLAAGVLALGARAPNDAMADFVEIAAGPFTMGADSARDPEAFDNERWSPAVGQGTVSVPTFYIARHEVTVGEFAAFAQGSTWTIDQRALAGPPTHPVTFVSWPDALAYCRWLETTLKTAAPAPRQTKALLASEWRVTLPSEAEWEKAARGTDGRRYPWGDAPQRARANYDGTGTTPVGLFACPECAYGLADMSGNVWEWTSSPYQPYPYDASNDRTNLDADALWVIRGGHYGDGSRLVRTTTRSAADPGARRAFIGFRVVISGPRPRTVAR
jgi:formylglycine-generating enzyme required for sulfatase activity